METAVSRSVRHWFVDRGIDPRFTAEPTSGLVSRARTHSDAEESLRYIYHQVTPLVKRLREWYSEEDLADLLFGRLSPEQVQMLGEEGEAETTPYDRFIIQSERQLRTTGR